MIGIPTPDEAPATTRSIWSDCLAFWEPRRLIYNGLLVMVVAVQLTQNHWWHRLFFQPAALAQLVVAVAVANLCYTSAHAVDMALQHSDFRSSWRERRNWLFVAGCVLAAALAHLSLGVLLTP